MTVEHKQLIEPKDVIAIQFECGTCGTRISYPLGSDRRPEQLTKCKVCNANWVTTASQEHDALRQFIEGMARIIPAMEGRPFKLLMETPDLSA